MMCQIVPMKSVLMIKNENKYQNIKYKSIEYKHLYMFKMVSL